MQLPLAAGSKVFFSPADPQSCTEVGVILLVVLHFQIPNSSVRVLNQGHLLLTPCDLGREALALASGPSCAAQQPIAGL